MKHRHMLLGASLALVISLPATAANRPAGYKTICNEGQTCSVQAPTRVAFGRADKFVYKDLNGSFVCSAATFNTKPVPGGKSECSVPSKPASSSSSSSSSSSAAITGSACTTSTGTVTINIGSNNGITVPAGTTYDGACKTHVFTNFCDLCEVEVYAFKVYEGATLKNVIIQGNNSGIALYGSTTLENISTDKVSRSYLVSQRAAGSSTISNVTLGSSADRVFQINGAGTMKVSNLIAHNIITGVFRQNGGTTFTSNVICDHCDIGPAPYLFRADSTTSTALLSNSVITGVTNVCYGYASGKCTQSNVTIK